MTSMLTYLALVVAPVVALELPGSDDDLREESQEALVEVSQEAELGRLREAVLQQVAAIAKTHAEMERIRLALNGTHAARGWGFLMSAKQLLHQIGGVHSEGEDEDENTIKTKMGAVRTTVMGSANSDFKQTLLWLSGHCNSEQNDVCNWLGYGIWGYGKDLNKDNGKRATFAELQASATAWIAQQEADEGAKEKVKAEVEGMQEKVGKAINGDVDDEDGDLAAATALVEVSYAAAQTGGSAAAKTAIGPVLMGIGLLWLVLNMSKMGFLGGWIAAVFIPVYFFFKLLGGLNPTNCCSYSGFLKQRFPPMHGEPWCDLFCNNHPSCESGAHCR